MTPERSGDARGLGRWGEDLAARHLTAQGYIVLARNFRSPYASGEADIVAQDGDALVVAEVKTRRSVRFGVPAESITWRKAARLIALLEAYRLDHPEAPPASRIDVVSVLVRSGAPPAITLIRNAVENRGAG